MDTTAWLQSAQMGERTLENRDEAEPHVFGRQAGGDTIMKDQHRRRFTIDLTLAEYQALGYAAVTHGVTKASIVRAWIRRDLSNYLVDSPPTPDGNDQRPERPSGQGLQTPPEFGDWRPRFRDR